MTRPAVSPRQRGMDAAGFDLMRDRMRGALVGAAVGDALGANVSERGEHSSGAERSFPVRTGALTELTHTTAESLFQRRRLDPDHLATTLATTFVRDSDRGYGSACAATLAAIAQGESWAVASAAACDGRGSWGGGAALRAVPVALMHPAAPGSVAADSRWAAAITHAHPRSVEGAAVFGAGVSILLRAQAPIDPGSFAAWLTLHSDHPALLDRLVDVVRVAEQGYALPDSRLPGGSAALDVIPTALAIFLANQGSFEKPVEEAVGRGGASRMLGALVGALAGALHGWSMIPHQWVTATPGSSQSCELADRFAIRQRRAAS